MTQTQKRKWLNSEVKRIAAKFSGCFLAKIGIGFDANLAVMGELRIDNYQYNDVELLFGNKLMQLDGAQFRLAGKKTIVHELFHLILMDYTQAAVHHACSECDAKPFLEEKEDQVVTRLEILSEVL